MANHPDTNPRQTSRTNDAWLHDVDIEAHLAALKNVEHKINISNVIAADPKIEERFAGEARKQNYAQRSSLIKALDLAVVQFNNPYLVGQAKAVQCAAAKSSQKSVEQKLSESEKQARQSLAMFKPTTPSKDTKFNGVERKKNIRMMEALDLDLSRVSENDRARLEKTEAKVMHNHTIKH